MANTDMSTLKGKTALVTGSTSGIGLGMAIALAKQGVNIMVNGFGEKDAAIAQIKACGVEVDYHGADMSKPAEIEDLIKQTEKRFGALDILVNNAGIQYTANIEDFPADKWDAIIAINLSSAFHTTHHALPGMQKRNWGRIINIASVHGLVASTQKAAYVALSMALLVWLKSPLLKMRALVLRVTLFVLVGFWRHWFKSKWMLGRNVSTSRMTLRRLHWFLRNNLLVNS